MVVHVFIAAIKPTVLLYTFIANVQLKIGTKIHVVDFCVHPVCVCVRARACCFVVNLINNKILENPCICDSFFFLK